MISKFMSWNGFPANVRFSIIHFELKTKYQVNSSKDSINHNTSFSDDARPKIWIRIPSWANYYHYY